MGVEGIVERLQEAPPQVPDNEISQDDQMQRYVLAKGNSSGRTSSL